MPLQNAARLFACLLLLAAASAGAPAPAAGEEAAWYPGPFGPQDRIGAANHLSPEAVKQAAALITRGKAYSLGLVVDAETPAYPPRKFQLVVTQSNDGTGATLGENRATGNDDLLISYLGIGSQIDGLGHLGINHRYYNGLHARDFVSPTGLKALGTEAIPPLVSRGVLLNMAALKGVSTVPEGTAYNRAELQAAAERQGVELRRGDIVLLHSGWHAVRESAPQKWWQMHPGLGVEGARYLAELGAVAVGADTTAVEVIPFENEARPFAVHQLLLAKKGVYLLENMYTDELARDGVHEFLFVLGQPKFRGAVQMVVNPIAIK